MRRACPSSACCSLTMGDGSMPTRTHHRHVYEESRSQHRGAGGRGGGRGADGAAHAWRFSFLAPERSLGQKKISVAERCTLRLGVMVQRQFYRRLGALGGGDGLPVPTSRALMCVWCVCVCLWQTFKRWIGARKDGARNGGRK